MADKAINSEEVIDKGLFDNAIKSADQFLSKAKEVEDQLKRNLTASKEFVGGFKTFDSKGLSDLAKESDVAARQLKNLEVVQQSILKTEKAKIQVEQELEKAARQKIQTEQLELKITNQKVKEVTVLTSSYDALRKQYNDLSRAQIELSVKGRENGVVFRAVKKDADALRLTLDKAEQGAGRFQRNVGNYASTFNGLGNSVNQLTRELPAFAVSANTGFLAISNNLPIFFDQLTKIRLENDLLIKQGKPIESVFSQVGKAIFSVGTVLSLAVTLLTIYGGTIVKTIGSLFSQADAFELNAEAMDVYNKSIERIKSAQDDLSVSIGNLQKQFIKNAKLIGESGEVQLDAIDKLGDALSASQKKRLKEVGELVIAQLKSGNKEIEIATRVKDNIIEIENKKTGEIIRLDKDSKKVIVKFSALYNKDIYSLNEKAIQDKLNNINEETRIYEQMLTNEYNLAIGNEYAKGESAKKIREKFSSDELIKKKTDLDRIRQLEIDNLASGRYKDEEQIRFDSEKALKEIDLANEVEQEKLKLAKKNYLENVKITKANVDNQAQQNIDLLKLTADYNKEVKKIEADNISKEEQIELRYQLQVNLNKRMLDLEDQFQKELAEKVKADLNKTYEARIKTNNALEEEEVKILEDGYQKKKARNLIFDADDLNRVNEVINEKKKLLIQEQADEKKLLTNNEAEKAQIQTDADIKKRDLDKKFADESKANRQTDLKQAAEFSNKVLDLAAKEEAQKSQIKIDGINKEIKLKEDAIDIQRKLAERGQSNTLAFEEERKRQLELQAQEEKKQEIKRQKVLAFFKLFASYAEKDPNTALQKALRDTVLAEAVSGAFFKGTEKVEDDLSGNKLHNGQDGYRIAVDGSERIMTGKQNELVGDMTNEQLAKLAHDHRMGVLTGIEYNTMPAKNFADNLRDSAMIHHIANMSNKIDGLTKVIKEKPVEQWEFNQYGEFIKTTIENGFNKRITYKQPKPRI